MQKIEIFKAGKRPDSNGNFTEIKVSQLAQAVTAYDPSLHEAPAVIGHPKDNAPAYAWVKGLSLEGDTLKAELTQIDPEFSEMVQMGRFKKFPLLSISKIVRTILNQVNYICAMWAF